MISLKKCSSAAGQTKKCLLVLMFAIAVQYGNAQPAHLSFDHLGIREGLPDNQINGILQDNQGYIWLTTYNGVVRYDGYRVKVYKPGIENKSNVPSQLFNNILQDKNHEIWVNCFNNGLFKYDRATDRFIQHKNKSIGKGEFSYLAGIDSTGKIWSGIAVNGLTYADLQQFDPATGKFKRYGNEQKGSRHISCKSIFAYIDPRGRIWAGTTNGLYLYSPLSDGFRAYIVSADTLKRKSIQMMYQARSTPGKIWVSVFDHRDKRRHLLLIDIESGQTEEFDHHTGNKNSLANDTVNTAFEDKKHRFWLGTNSGLSLYNDKTKQFTNYSPVDTIQNRNNKNQVYSLKEDKYGNFWLSSGDGLLCFNPETGVFKRYIHDKNDPASINSGGLNDFLFDREGTLWIAFDNNGGGGADHVNTFKSAFTPLNTSGRKFPWHDIAGMAETPDGLWWIAALNGLYRYDRTSSAVKLITPGIVYTVITTRNGLVYYSSADKSGAGDGLRVYDPKTGKTEQYKTNARDSASLSNNAINCMLEDHSGMVWIGTQGGGICAFDPNTKKFKRYPYIANNLSKISRNVLDDSAVQWIYEDRAGTLWAGTLLGGLNRLDRKRNTFISSFEPHNALSTIYSINQDNKGRLWVGTYFNGLFWVDNHTGTPLKRFTEKEGCLMDQAAFIHTDQSDFMWVESRRGFSRINTSDFSIKNYKTEGNSWESIFNENFGVLNIKNHMVIYGGDKLVLFDPKAVTRDADPPLVHLQDIAYGDPRSEKDTFTSVEAYGRSKIELPWNENKISFNYVALDYINPAENKYTYQLEGYDNHWVQAGLQRSVTYTNLPPGTYTFRVKASNSDGVWNTKGDSFILIIHSPWWFTWWAWVLYAVAAAGAIWGFVQYRSRALLKEKRILEEKVQERTTEVMEQKEELLQQKEAIEEQAREAQIEVALERVRSRAMAMRNSDELKLVAQVVSEQLREFGFHIDSTIFFINYKQGDDLTLWIAAKDHQYPAEMFLPYFDQRPLSHLKDAKQNGLDFITGVLSFEEKNEFCAHFFAHAPSLPQELKDVRLRAPGYVYAVVLMKNIALSIVNYGTTPYSDDETAILRRFAAVFEQSYTRFLDLQQAEASEREAIKQSSLDRIRGEIASMRSAADLERITPLFWSELTHLGVPFIRCGVFIVDEEKEQIHTYLSTPDGKALASYPLPFDTKGLGRDILTKWRKKQVYINHWSEAEFKDWTKNLVEQHIVESQEKYMTVQPPASLDLHFFPFEQGMLYVGNTGPLADEEMDLVQAMTDAFSAAYARYEDFSKLETAKKSVENTLSELRSAQTQLIQSEKMASLGELTAGIAHEIQNPLNFVNNFSDVSIELLDEMQSELANGDADEATALAVNIKGNLEKISLHGRRADAIVKNMLQHSRSNSGEKKPADINALADEYMRLAYHGLRAKDKSFNAVMHTDFDSTIGKISIVQQDIGRVLINLYNNAFYATSEKKKQAGESFEPTLTVKTRKAANMAVITVRDNGNGIPQKVLDKIFQPFFTTKPTGQGTGLGLSLSYDIVKAHGGGIKAETVEGEFTEFMVSLPIS